MKLRRKNRNVASSPYSRRHVLLRYGFTMPRVRNTGWLQRQLIAVHTLVHRATRVTLIADDLSDIAYGEVRER